MRNSFTLSNGWMYYLADCVETGPGYQSVNIKLKNGKTLKRIIVVGCQTIEKSKLPINFNNNDIKSMTVNTDGDNLFGEIN